MEVWRSAGDNMLLYVCNVPDFLVGSLAEIRLRARLTASAEVRFYKAHISLSLQIVLFEGFRCERWRKPLDIGRDGHDGKKADRFSSLILSRYVYPRPEEDIVLCGIIVVDGRKDERKISVRRKVADFVLVIFLRCYY